MIRWKALAIGAVVAAVATATFVPLAFRGARGVQTLPPGGAASVAFDREQSAALFVGVRRFTHDEIVEVPYAVDDAVDLAYTFVFDPQVHLIPASHVVLALSGRPKKPESQKRLRDLQEAGAGVERADQSDILSLLHKQAALAGKDGILIVSLATHGFARKGIGYILGSASLARYPDTTLSTASLLDIIDSSSAQRSLVLIDACRERMNEGTRAVTASAASSPSTLFHRMSRIRGQVILYAAAEGEYAYDDEESGNGVFTKAVLDGLRCNATAVRGVVTAETLSEYVDRHVRTWIRGNRDASAGAGIQWSIDGEAKNMPLAICTPTPRPPGVGEIASLSISGSTVIGKTAAGACVWKSDAGDTVRDAEIVNLAGTRRQAVAGTQHAIVAFDESGNRRWSNSEQDLTLRLFVLADLHRKQRREAVALWDTPSGTRLTVYEDDGSPLGSYDFQARFDRLIVDRPTSHHAPKIIVSGMDESGAVIAVFDPKKVSHGKPVWMGHVSSTITRLTTIPDDDGHQDIAVETASGATVVVDFDGNVVRGGRPTQFQLVPKSRRSR